MTKTKLARLVKDISPTCYKPEKIVSFAIKDIYKIPGQLYALIEKKDKTLCIEYDPVEYKEKECFHGSDPNIDEYCLVLIIKNNIEYEEYFKQDITDEMIAKVKQIWNDK